MVMDGMDGVMDGVISAYVHMHLVPRLCIYIYTCVHIYRVLQF